MIRSESRKTGLPDNLERKLIEFRTRLWKIKFAEGILAALCGFLLAYLLLFAIERFVPASTWLRAAILCVGAVGIGVFFPLKLHRWIWRTRKMEQVARVLMRRLPSLGEQILGVVELAHDRTLTHNSRLAEAAINQMDERIRDQDLSNAVPTPRHRLWGTAAAIPAVAALAAMFLAPAAARNAWLRYVNPWATTPRYTFTRIEGLPAEIITPYAEPFTLTARLASDSDWHPDSARAVLSGVTHHTRLEQNANYSFELPGQTEPSELTLRAGDVAVRTRVTPTTRPELVAVKTEIYLPEYLQYSEPLQVETNRGSFSVLEGSGVRFTAQANRDLHQASFDNRTLPVQGSTVQTSSSVVNGDSQHVLTWQDRYGLTSAKPIEIRVYSTDDQAPTLLCDGLADDLVLLQSDTVKFEVSASDDFGVRQIGLEWLGVDDPLANPEPARGERTVAVGGPQSTQLAGSATLTPTSENIKPQLLQLRAFTEDFLAGRGRVYSPTYTVRILSEDQHAQWISEQLHRWQSKADAVYEEELRLLEQNRQLRQWSDDERARPETRRTLEQQAVAERANAEKLKTATDSGRNLLDQAVRNESIRADQIAEWASVLQQLQRVADERMPSIADELDRLAKAAPSMLRSNRPKVTPENQLPASESAGLDRDSSGSDQDQKGDSEREKERNNENPSVVDRESSMQGPSDQGSKEGDENEGGSPSRLTLPETQLRAAGGSDDGSDKGSQQNQQPSPSDDPIDEIVEDQTRLIEEFRNAREALNDLMGDFENSSFVKRLKAASRNQLDLARRINRLVGKQFGVSPTEDQPIDESAVVKLAEAQTSQSRALTEIRNDLVAYQNRDPQASRQAILDEMRELNMQVKLEEMPLRLQRNLTGDALHRTEFWADTFDRWAEELVAPSKSVSNNEPNNDGDSANLPPALLVEIMRIINGEIDLRDETRTLGQLKPSADPTEYEERSTGLAVAQMAVQERTLEAIGDIEILPSGGNRFSRELDKLRKAILAMDEASGLLTEMETSAETLAAETTAIETLLASRRSSDRAGSGSGDGGGPGSLSSGNTNRSPLDLLGPDSDPTANIAPRDVGSGVGAVRGDLPEEYRDGLDAFMNGISELTGRSEK